MAGTVRDLFLAVRVVDRASGPLRRISSDLRRMQGVGDVANQRSRIASQSAILAKQRESLNSEIQSVQTGKLREASNKRIAIAQSAVANSERDIERLGTRISANTANRLNLMNQIRMASRGLSRAEASETGMFGGKSPEMWATQVQRIMVQQQAAATLQQRLQRDMERATSVRASTAVGVESTIAAEEANRISTLKRLTSTIYATGVAETGLARETSHLDEVERRFNNQQRLATWGQRSQIIKHAGQVMTIFGGAATVAFGLAAKAAADFQTQVTVAATQSTVAGRNTVAQVLTNSKFLQNALQRMMASGKVIAGPSEQTKSIYEIFSGLTLKGSQTSQLRQGIALLKDFNRVVTANAGLVSLEEVTKAGIVLMNRFGLTVAQVPKALNTMQAAVRFGALNMSQFVSTLSQAAPAAQSAGYNFTQMAAGIAFVSRQFPAIRLGTTGYARMIETLANKNVIAGLRAHGVEVTHVVNGTRKLLPVNEIATRILGKFGGSVKQGSIFLQNFFKEMGNTAGTIQARRVLQAYLGHLDSAKRILLDVTRDHNELEKSFLAASQSPGVRFQAFKVQLQALAITIGAAVIPVIAVLGRYLERLIQWFQNLSPHTKEMIGRWGAIISLLTLAGGVILSVVGALGSMYFALALLVGSRGLAGLSAEAGFVNARLVLLMGTLGVLLFVWYKWPDAVNSAVRALGGFKFLLETLVVTGIAFKLARIALNIGLIGSSAIVATGEVGGLRAGLLALPPEISIPIVLTVATVVGGKALQKYVTKPGGLKEKVQEFFGAAPPKPKEGDISTNGVFIYKNGKWTPRITGAEDVRAGVLTSVRQRELADAAMPRQVRAAAGQFGATLTPNVKALARAYVTAARAARAAELAEQKRPSTENFNKSVAAEQKFQVAMDNLRNAATKQQFNAYKKATDSLLKAQDDRNKKLKQNFRSTIDSVKQMYDQFLQQEQSNFGALFSGPMQGILQFRQQWGAKPTGQLLLGDLQGQLRTYTHFNNAIATLSRRGAPAELVKQLQAAGPQALPDILALTRMPRGMWDQYVNTFSKAQATIKDQTMKDLNRNLSMYRRFGSNVGQAIQQGLADESPGLRRELRNTLESMFPQLKTGARPSTRAGSPQATHTHTTHNHNDTTNIHTKSDPGEVNSALAKHRARIRNRPHYGGHH